MAWKIVFFWTFLVLLLPYWKQGGNLMTMAIIWRSEELKMKTHLLFLGSGIGSVAVVARRMREWSVQVSVYVDLHLIALFSLPFVTYLYIPNLCVCMLKLWASKSKQLSSLHYQLTLQSKSWTRKLPHVNLNLFKFNPVLNVLSLSSERYYTFHMRKHNRTTAVLFMDVRHSISLSCTLCAYSLGR